MPTPRRAPRFFLPPPLYSDAELALPEPVFRHAVQVLRLKPGAPLTLFDGGGGEYRATLLRVGRREAVARVGAHDPREAESPLAVDLVQTLAKGERTDFVLQKAVELGVASVTLIFSARGVVRLDRERLDRRAAHWRGVIRAACEQCGRNRVPALRGPLPFADWLAAAPPPGPRLLLDPNAAAADLAAPPPPAAQLLVGPEGGFDAAETQAARAAGFCGIRLGPRVLRTETAALAALAALQTVWGDLACR